MVEALARIEMLVERGAVEAGEAVRIGREVRRHPVEDDAEPGGMGASTKRAKPSGEPKRAVGANRPSGW